MPEQEAVQSTPEWSQESVEKQAAEQKLDPVDPVEPVEGEQVEKVKEERVVPLAAVQEERAKRREATSRAQALEAQVQQLQRSHLEMLQRMQQGQQAQPPAADDVLGQLQYATQQTQAQVQQLTAAQQQQLQRQYQEQQTNMFVQAVRSHEQEFTKTQPDAAEGINFLKRSRVEEYKAAGLSHQQAVDRMNYDEQQLVVWAMQNGENPAEAAFQMAVKRGYVSPKAKLAMQQEGQRASMPTGGGGSGGGDPTLQALLKMSPGDFAKATAGDNWAKLMKKHA